MEPYDEHDPEDAPEAPHDADELAEPPAADADEDAEA